MWIITVTDLDIPIYWCTIIWVNILAFWCLMLFRFQYKQKPLKHTLEIFSTINSHRQRHITHPKSMVSSLYCSTELPSLSNNQIPYLNSAHVEFHYLIWFFVYHRLPSTLLENSLEKPIFENGNDFQFNLNRFMATMSAWIFLHFRICICSVICR